MTSVDCDVVILPSAELAEKAVDLSRRLQAHGGMRFTLQPEVCVPHLSIYYGVRLRLGDLDKVGGLLQGLAARTATLHLTATHYNQGRGYLSVAYARNEILDQLHMIVIEAVNPLRDGLRDKDRTRLQKASGELRESLEKYGTRGAGTSFQPHMTLTRFVNDQPIDIDGLPEPDELSGAFTELGLFELGDNGTCRRKIVTFPFREANFQ